MASGYPLEKTSLWRTTRKKPKRKESEISYFTSKIRKHLPQVDLPAPTTRIDNPTQKSQQILKQQLQRLGRYSHGTPNSTPFHSKPIEN